MEYRLLVGGYVINLLKGVTLIEVPLLGALKAWQIAFLVVGLPGIIIGFAIYFDS